MPRFAQLQRFFLIVSLAAVLGLPLLVGQHKVRTAPSIPAGIEHIHQRNGEIPWSIHIIRIDRASKDIRFTSTVSGGRILGLGTVSEQAEAVNQDGWTPVAAINGDFFRIENGPYQGDMLGLQITSGTLISSPSNAAFWIGRDGAPHIGFVTTKIQVAIPGDETTSATTITAGLNGPRVDGRAVLYTTEFGDTTRTDDDGIELVLVPEAGGPAAPLTVSSRTDLRIAKIHEDGDNDIRPGTMVLSIQEDLADKLPALDKKMVLRMTVKSDPDLTGVATAIGGGPILVRRGKVNPDAGQAVRHPRTAIGYNSKSIFLVVVDGRQSSLSVGMTMPELAQFMADLGATEALNMDGGGSSELWLGGQVVNSPSEGHERAVANALVVLSRKK